MHSRRGVLCQRTQSPLIVLIRLRQWPSLIQLMLFFFKTHTNTMKKKKKKETREKMEEKKKGNSWKCSNARNDPRIWGTKNIGDKEEEKERGGEREKDDGDELRGRRAQITHPFVPPATTRSSPLSVLTREKLATRIFPLNFFFF